LILWASCAKVWINRGKPLKSLPFRNLKMRKITMYGELYGTDIEYDDVIRKKPDKYDNKKRKHLRKKKQQSRRVKGKVTLDRMERKEAKKLWEIKEENNAWTRCVQDFNAIEFELSLKRKRDEEFLKAYGKTEEAIMRERAMWGWKR
jgi:hypothetical protein